MHQWHCYDKNGDVITQGGRAILLTLESPQAHRRAKRRQRAAFYKAWKSGELEFCEHSRIESEVGWIMLVAAAAVTWWSTKNLFLKPFDLWNDSSTPMSSEYTDLSSLVAMLMVILAVLTMGLLLRGAWFFLAVPLATRVRIDQLGIHATLRNGREEHANWSDIVNITGINVKLRDGRVIWISGNFRRVWLTLGIAWDAQNPEWPSPSEQRKARWWLGARACLFSLLTGVLTYYCMTLVNAVAPDNGSKISPLPTAVILTAVTLPVFAPSLTALAIELVIRRLRHFGIWRHSAEKQAKDTETSD